jgi:predicted heme/steroid binding protein
MVASWRTASARYELSLGMQALSAFAAVYAWNRLSGEVRRWRAERAYRDWERKYRLPKRDYTMDEVNAFDGSDPDKPILIVLKRRVFNVSVGADFYGKHGPYNIFAGKDADWLLAKNELEFGTEAEMSKPLTTLEQQELDGWYEHFRYKYDLLGEIVDRHPAAPASAAPVAAPDVPRDAEPSAAHL